MYYSLIALFCTLAVSFACIPSNSPCLNGVESEPLPAAQSGSTVTDASELSCTFDEPCCWSDNVADSEELEAKVVTNPGALLSCFPALVPNTGNFYSVYGKNLQAHPGATAELSSCPIECSPEGSTTDVTVSALKSATSKLEVCTRDASSPNAAPENCETYTALSGQPQTFNMPGGKDYQIVLVSSNFNTATDFINIEEIQVTAEPCPTTTTTTTTEATTTTTEATTTTVSTIAPGTDLCSKAACSFENDLCNWQNEEPKPEHKDNYVPFKPYAAGFIVGNYDTGVNALAASPTHPMTLPEVSESAFAGTPMNPKQEVSMAITGLNVVNNSIMKFRAYDATFNHLLQVCLNGLDECTDVTDNGVAVEHRQWQDVSVAVPAGTQSIHIVGANLGDYYGAVGVSDIEIVNLETGETCQ